MTSGERMVWAAVFAAYRRSPGPSREVGHVSRAQIIRDAARAASSALIELRELARCRAGDEGGAGVIADVREVLSAEDAP